MPKVESFWKKNVEGASGRGEGSSAPPSGVTSSWSVHSALINTKAGYQATDEVLLKQFFPALVLPCFSL